MCFHCVSQTEVKFSSKCHKKIQRASPGVTLHCCSCCITPRGYEFIQCLSIWHPVHQEISQAERASFTLQKHIFLSALCVTSLSLALILFYSFCDEKHITRHAAQEILFRLVIAQKTQREGRESERGLFLTEAISQRSPLARLRNLWVWLKVKKAKNEVKLQLWLCHNTCLTEISVEAFTTRGSFHVEKKKRTSCSFFF